MVLKLSVYSSHPNIYIVIFILYLHLVSTKKASFLVPQREMHPGTVWVK